MISKPVTLQKSLSCFKKISVAPASLLGDQFYRVGTYPGTGIFEKPPG